MDCQEKVKRQSRSKSYRISKGGVGDGCWVAVSPKYFFLYRFINWLFVRISCVCVCWLVHRAIEVSLHFIRVRVCVIQVGVARRGCDPAAGFRDKCIRSRLPEFAIRSITPDESYPLHLCL